MKATVSDRGRVTIPKALPKQLGLRAGHVFEFSEERGRLVTTRFDPTGSVSKVFGILRLDCSVDRYIAGVRGSARSH